MTQPGKVRCNSRAAEAAAIEREAPGESPPAREPTQDRAGLRAGERRLDNIAQRLEKAEPEALAV